MPRQETKRARMEREARGSETLEKRVDCLGVVRARGAPGTGRPKPGPGPGLRPQRGARRGRPGQAGPAHARFRRGWRAAAQCAPARGDRAGPGGGGRWAAPGPPDRPRSPVRFGPVLSGSVRPGSVRSGSARLGPSRAASRPPFLTVHHAAAARAGRAGRLPWLDAGLLLRAAGAGAARREAARARLAPGDAEARRPQARGDGGGERHKPPGGRHHTPAGPAAPDGQARRETRGGAASAAEGGRERGAPPAGRADPPGAGPRPRATSDSFRPWDPSTRPPARRPAGIGGTLGANPAPRGSGMSPSGTLWGGLGRKQAKSRSARALQEIEFPSNGPHGHLGPAPQSFLKR